MPLHAKVLTALLSLSLLLALAVLGLGGVNSTVVIDVVLRALLLAGFLKGNEGVRSLLMFGAGINVILGGFGLFASLAVMSSDATGGMPLAASAGFTAAVGLYMLFALRNHEVQQWMLNRSLGGALDE